MERNGGLRSLLTVPRIYELSQAALYRRRVLDDRLRNLFPGLGTALRRVLDIGCGPATFLAHYGRVADFEYTGFDPSVEYIQKAGKRFPGRGTFLVGTTESFDPGLLGRFDLIVADGVLHHVSDTDVVSIARFARNHLAEGGRFVTLDPVRVPKQHPIASLLMALDRGARIRTASEYHSLLDEGFGSGPTGAIVHGRLRLPYDHWESVSMAPVPA